MYLYVRSAADIAAAALCAAIRLLLLLQQLLLFVIVCRRTKNNVAGSLKLIPCSVFFLFNHTRFCFCISPWQYCRICGLDCLYYILGNYGRSQGRRQPATIDFAVVQYHFWPPWAAFVGRALAQCPSLLHSVCSRCNTANTGAYLIFVMLWCCEYCESNSA